MTTVAEKFYGLSSHFKRDLIEGIRIKDIAPRWTNIIYAQSNGIYHTSGIKNIS